MLIQTETKVTLPNFLIAGQAKCGTSSLAKYLSQHPDVFLSKKKEPRFLSSQSMPTPLGGPLDHKVEAWYVKDIDSYIDLFRGTTQSAIGEASADTLYYYHRTIPTIKHYLNNPKIIIILRDPVKRAFSAWQHLMRDGREKLPFAQALLEEEKRKAENWEIIYHYTGASFYYNAVKAYMDNFTDVMVVLNEDLYAQPQKVLSDVFKFIEVNTDVEIDTSVVYNASGIPKIKWLHKVLSEEHPVRKMGRFFTRTLLSPKRREQIVTNMLRKNLKRLSMPSQEAEQLRQLFRPDIEKLEVLLKRDLSHWKG